MNHCLTGKEIHNSKREPLASVRYGERDERPFRGYHGAKRTLNPMEKAG